MNTDQYLLSVMGVVMSDDLKKLLKTWAIDDHCSMAFAADGMLESSGASFSVHSPSTEEQLIAGKYASIACHQQIVEAASTSQKKWALVPAPVRGQLILELGLLIRKYKHDLALAISHEVGKTMSESLGEVQEMIDMADMAVGQSRMLNGLTMHSERPEHRMYEQWHPLGVVAVVTAFNFPAAVWAWNAMLAVIAGNVVLWKPSPKTIITSVIIQKICYMALDNLQMSGVFFLSLPDNSQVHALIADNPKIPLVSFTGSTAVGRQIATAVAARLGKSLLELSGNNASIVCRSANLDLVIPAVVFAAVGTSGQRCTSLRRLYVHQELYETVVQRLIHAYQQLKIGLPWLPDTLVGPLIDRPALDKFLATIAKIKQLGGRIHIGGERIGTSGYFVQPAIVSAESDWQLLKQETFGPILYIVPFAELPEAIAAQNNSQHGLSSSIFSQDLAEVEQFLSVAGSDCGIANVNMGPSGAEIGGAFGGEKDTGGGREAGSDAWKAYMRRQTCTINYGQQLPLAQGINFECS